MTMYTSHPTVRHLRRREIKLLDMKLFLTVLVSSVLAVTSGSWLDSTRHRRESKWNIIHHEYHGPPAPLAKDGRVIDTPEVKKARTNHLAIHAETIVDLAKMMSKAESEGQREAQPQATLTIPPEVMAIMMGHGQEEAEEKKEEEEEAKEEEIKPVVEHEVDNEVDFGHPTVTLQANYEGPLAPIGKDGRVLDTPEVKKAKEAHFSAYKEVAKLATKEDEWKPMMASAGDSGEEAAAPEEAKSEVKLEAHAWYERPQERHVYASPVHMLYHQDAPMGYEGPAAPLGEDGRVVDTAEVERAKAAHLRAHQHARAIAKRHPPRPEDNSI